MPYMCAGAGRRNVRKARKKERKIFYNSEKLRASMAKIHISPQAEPPLPAIITCEAKK